jgi:predicted benzoate:H+ symporter BenE
MLNVSCALIGLFKLIVDERSLGSKSSMTGWRKQASFFFTAEDASPIYRSSWLDVYKINEGIFSVMLFWLAKSPVIVKVC